jgi:hypothetical protein
MPTGSITTLTVDHVASSTAPCRLDHEVRVSPYVVAEEGYCLAVRALDDKDVYNQLEGADGVFRTIEKGQTLVGALGERQALKGYSGRIPRHIAPGDVLHVQNMGGILGRVATEHPDLGPALRVEVLGAVLTGEPPRHARIQDTAVDPVEVLTESAPLVMVSGTAMNTGKTFAAAALVGQLTGRGLRVAAAKLTGAALQRDVRAMVAQGAVASASFLQAGAVATTGRDMVPIAKGIIAHLNRIATTEDGTPPDALVLELGDGVIGPYGVDQILEDMELQRPTSPARGPATSCSARATAPRSASSWGRRPTPTSASATSGRRSASRPSTRARRPRPSRRSWPRTWPSGRRGPAAPSSPRRSTAPAA